MPEEIGITLDGRAVKAIKGEMIIAAAERAGTYIPRFCYHPRMKPVGMCRMCLVEVKGPRGFSLSPACFVPVAEGMEVVTNSAPVKKAQDGVLEFLLVNHPLDCPVCDKGGECPLQDQTMAYGPGETRFVEEKRHWDKPMPLSPLVLIDRERCIQCARCTRFAEEVAGDAGIDFASRSDSTEVAIYPGQPFGSNFSGNIVQICPVGALLAKPYRFKARPWDLEQVESTCSYCAVGCRVAVQSSSDQLVRFIGVDSDPVNWGWLCDKGRFGFEAVNSPDRLARPLVRRSGPGLVEAAWADAFAEIIARLSGVPGERIGVLGGSRLANEDAYAWAKFARTVLRTDNVDAQVGDGLPGDLVASLPRATIDQVCDASLIVTLAPDIKEELPVLYLRLRHAAVEKGVPIIEISPGPTGLSSRATECLHYRPGELSSLVEALCGGTPVKDDIAGIPAQQVERARSAIASVTRDAAAPDGTGADGTGADGTGADGTGAPRLAVVLGRASLAEPSTATAAAARLLARLPGVSFLPALRRSNVHGALDFGLSPGLLPGRVGLEDGRQWYEHHWGAPLPATAGLDALGMLARAAAGQLDVLFLLGSDPLSDCPDSQLAAQALDGAGCVIAIDAFRTASVAQADVVLPAAMYTERRGTFTNLEGRVSWLGQKVTAPGGARPDWMIAVELASRLGTSLGAASLEDLWAEIETVSPLHRGVSHALLVSRQERNGVVVPLALGAPSAELTDMPAPLDPMADPGIASAELHPAPPVLPSVVDPGAGRTNMAVAGPEGTQAEGGAAGAGRGAPGEAPASGDLAWPPRLGLGPAGPVAPAPAPPPAETSGSRRDRDQGDNGHALRLVVSRPMWDGGVLVQRSPSLARLHPPFALRVNPADLSRLGDGQGGEVRVSTPRGSLVVAAVPDARVAPGSAVLPFNLPEGGAGPLIDASAAYTELTVGPVSEP
ncbi:MAG: NADH-quinone oxidoreductase subunit NuoG [Acidimicrobiales bacterium]